MARLTGGWRQYTARSSRDTWRTFCSAHEEVESSGASSSSADAPRPLASSVDDDKATRAEGGRPSFLLAACTASISRETASISCSTSPADCRKVESTSLASSCLPLPHSQRGDSGRNAKPRSCSAPGTSARPTLTRHSCPALSIPLRLLQQNEKVCGRAAFAIAHLKFVLTDVHEAGHELPGDDAKIIEDQQEASLLGRRGLRDVHGHGHRSDPNRHAEKNPA
eukprot:scaffold1352_cov261-Pinguiococcus_pyrenoidosus.AAC.2